MDRFCGMLLHGLRGTYLQQQQSFLKKMESANQEAVNGMQATSGEAEIRASSLSQHSVFELFSIQIKQEHYFAKVFPSHQTHLFVRERLLLEQLYHPNIIKPVDSDSQLASRLSNFLKSEVLLFPQASRGNMQDYLKRNGPFSEQVAKFYISQLISALQYCETVEVSHPNINASNILIEESGNILLCGWTNSSQTIKNQTKSLPFRLGELIVEMLTSRKLFTSSSLKHDTYGKFLSAKHIHKLWEQLEKTCAKIKNFSLSNEVKKLVSALFLGKMHDLEEIGQSGWLHSVPTLAQIQQQLLLRQAIKANKL